MENHTVYILKSEKLNRHYVGYTGNLTERLLFHRSAEARKFTANADDWFLIFKIDCMSKTQGLGIERHIKKMKSSIYIENLLRYPEMTDRLLKKYSGN